MVDKNKIKQTNLWWAIKMVQQKRPLATKPEFNLWKLNFEGTAL